MSKLFYNLKRVVEKTANSVMGSYYKFQANKYFDLSIKGAENIPETSAMVVANHCVFVDGFLLFSALKQESGRMSHFWIQNENVYDRPSLKAFLWAQGHIPVNVDKRSSNKAIFKRTAEYLKWSNDFIAVFAEGPTKDLINENGEMPPISERTHYRGAAINAVKNNVPVLPVALRSCDEIERETWKFGLTKEGNAKDFIKKYIKENGKPPYYVNIGKPIYPDSSFHHKKAATTLSDLVREEVIRLASSARDIE